MLFCEVALVLIGYRIEESSLLVSHRVRHFEVVAFQRLHALDLLGDGGNIKNLFMLYGPAVWNT